MKKAAYIILAALVVAGCCRLVSIQGDDNTAPALDIDLLSSNEGDPTDLVKEKGKPQRPTQ